MADLGVSKEDLPISWNLALTQHGCELESDTPEELGIGFLKQCGRIPLPPLFPYLDPFEEIYLSESESEYV